MVSGSATDSGESRVVAVAFGIMGFIFNLVLFAIIIDRIRDSLNEYHVLYNRVVRNDHTIIVGWTKKVLQLFHILCVCMRVRVCICVRLGARALGLVFDGRDAVRRDTPSVHRGYCQSGHAGDGESDQGLHMRLVRSGLTLTSGGHVRVLLSVALFQRQ